MTVAQILEQAKKLPSLERYELIKLLMDTLNVEAEDQSFTLMDFEGIAAHLADEEDPQDHVSRLRDEWTKNY